jgi:putative nucleotidyltransferase with HDIG domain
LVSAPGLSVHTARSATEAMHRLQSDDYAVVVSGHKPPDLDGFSLLERSALYRSDAMRILALPSASMVSALEARFASAPVEIFHVVGRGPGRGNLGPMVAQGLRLQMLVREQRDLVHRLGLEYDKLQKREKLLDVVVRERTKELEESYERLKEANRQALFGLAEAIEAKDAYTKGHCGRVAGYSLALASELGYGDDALETLEFGAFLHDIGKIGVKDHVLLKPGPLDDAEWKHMREHPVMGYEIAKEIAMLNPIMPAVRNHHERWDGHGYPDGLAGESIPVSARLVAIADAYDALATDRPYKTALPLDECEMILRKNAGKMFDPELVEVFCIRHIGALYREAYDKLAPPGANAEASSSSAAPAPAPAAAASSAPSSPATVDEPVVEDGGENAEQPRDQYAGAVVS